MPPTKTARKRSTRTTRSAAKRGPKARKPTAKRTKQAKPQAKKSMSAAHKKALADGRRISKTVDTYIRVAIQTPKTRGRKVSTAAIKSRLEDARQKVTTETGVNMLLAVQAVRDLDVKLHARTNGNSETARKQATAAFIKVARAFSESRNISYASWRDIGVPAAVLKQAGVKRTREG